MERVEKTDSNKELIEGISVNIVVDSTFVEFDTVYDESVNVCEEVIGEETVEEK